MAFWKSVKEKMENGTFFPLWGFEWKSRIRVLGIPLVHIALGRDRKTGRLLVAKGIIAIGQFAIGVIAVAQFAIGALFSLGQFSVGLVAVAQFAVGILFGMGQFATGLTAIAQFGFGKYVLAQMGYGQYVWSSITRDLKALEYFAHWL